MLHNKKFVPEFRSLISNWFDMREQAPGANLLHDSVSGASSLVCTDFALHDRISGASSLVCTGWGTYPGACFGSVFQEQAPSCVLVGVLTQEHVSGVCFGSVFQEQAPSCVYVPALRVQPSLNIQSVVNNY